MTIYSASGLVIVMTDDYGFLGGVIMEIIMEGSCLILLFINICVDGKRLTIR